MNQDTSQEDELLKATVDNQQSQQQNHTQPVVNENPFLEENPYAESEPPKKKKKGKKKWGTLQDVTMTI